MGNCATCDDPNIYEQHKPIRKENEYKENNVPRTQPKLAI